MAQADYATEHLVRDINVEAARLARAAADEWTARTPDRPRFVAGAIGPTNRMLSISPDVEDPAARAITFDELRAAYAEQVRGLIDGGADLLLVETIIDGLGAKAALFAIDEVAEETGTRLPVMISVTVTDRSGRTLAGQTIDAFWITIAHARPFSVGPELRAGGGRHAPVPGRPRARGHLLDELLPERRPAERLRRVRRDAGRDRGRAARGSPRAGWSTCSEAAAGRRRTTSAPSRPPRPGWSPGACPRPSR